MSVEYAGMSLNSGEFKMNMTINLTEGAELRIAGSPVGVFLPEAKLRELVEERDSLRQQLEDERRKAESLAQQSEECQRLKMELNAVKKERDQYAKALTAAAGKLFPPIDEETAAALVAECETNGVDFAEVMREIEEICHTPREDRRVG
jgi:hypothetical protein